MKRKAEDEEDEEEYWEDYYSTDDQWDDYDLSEEEDYDEVEESESAEENDLEWPCRPERKKVKTKGEEVLEDISFLDSLEEVSDDLIQVECLLLRELRRTGKNDGCERDGEEKKALHLAVCLGKADIVYFILENFKCTHEDCVTAIKVAAMKGYVDILKVLIKDMMEDEIDLEDIIDEKETTPLHLAACLGNILVMHIIIENFANVEKDWFIEILGKTWIICGSSIRTSSRNTSRR